MSTPEQPLELYPYSTDQFSFSRALHIIKQGGKVARVGWNGKNMFIFMVPGSTFKVNRAPVNTIFAEGTEISYHPHIDIKAQDGTLAAWNPSQIDLFAEDWVEMVPF